MRQGVDSLSGLVLNEMQFNPCNGYWFVFFNRRRTHVKILTWDIDGFFIHYKKLDKGTFKQPSARINIPNYQLSSEELYLILRGIDFEKTKKRNRYFSTKYPL